MTEVNGRNGTQKPGYVPTMCREILLEEFLHGFKQGAMGK